MPEATTSSSKEPSTTAIGGGSENKDLKATIGSKVSEQLRRGSPAYQTILQAAQWQRDNYLMGQGYANKRKREREVRPNRVFLPRIGYGVRIDPHGMGVQQLSALAASFIPSPTVKQALMPLVLQQLTYGGSLYQPALSGLVSLIDSQQANVDELVRTNILDLLEQERLRKLVMSSTKGYIAEKGSDAPPIEK